MPAQQKAKSGNRKSPRSNHRKARNALKYLWSSKCSECGKPHFRCRSKHRVIVGMIGDGVVKWVPEKRARG